MKIAILTSTFPPYSGGIGNVAAFNAKELVKLGHDVTVFTPLYQPVAKETKDLKIIRIKPRFKYGNAAYVPKLKKMLKGFDIIHLHYPFFGGAEVVWQKRRRWKKQGTKIVLHYHMDVVGSGLLKSIFSLHKVMLLGRMIKMADKVILTSFDYGQNSDLAKWLAKEPEKFVAVPNGVDTKKFFPMPKDSDLLKKYDLAQNEKVVLFVGGLDKAHYFKGVEFLLEAMARLGQVGYGWRLIIVGGGDLQEYYASIANQLRIHKKTIFTGRVGDQDLPKHYNLADVCILPSVDKSEAFGLVLVEAMACGKPVIATNLAGVRSVVTDNINGLLVEPKNADDLANKINYILNNPAEAENFGRAGLIQARAKYDWQIIGNQLEAIYKSLKP
ncbi:MAG: glycosyltransferase family 4 protein [Candidatus Buchananbacteria bacterium]